MKTKLNNTMMLILISVIITFSLILSDFTFKDEPHIDDIPISTEIIFDSLKNHEFVFEEEDYIDDIPFNTCSIAIESANEIYEDLYELEMTEKWCMNRL